MSLDASKEMGCLIHSLIVQPTDLSESDTRAMDHSRRPQVVVLVVTIAAWDHGWNGAMRKVDGDGEGTCN